MFLLIVICFIPVYLIDLLHATFPSIIDFDQLIVHLSNIKHDPSALKGLLSHNSALQHPTVVVASVEERSKLSNYLDSEHLHSAILVNPSLDARDRANYKSELALILARKIFRKYKKY